MHLASNPFFFWLFALSNCSIRPESQALSVLTNNPGCRQENNGNRAKCKENGSTLGNLLARPRKSTWKTIKTEASPLDSSARPPLYCRLPGIPVPD